jgi:hypothetical protein
MSTPVARCVPGFEPSRLPSRLLFRRWSGERGKQAGGCRRRGGPARCGAGASGRGRVRADGGRGHAGRGSKLDPEPHWARQGDAQRQGGAGEGGDRWRGKAGSAASGRVHQSHIHRGAESLAGAEVSSSRALAHLPPLLPCCLPLLPLLPVAHGTAVRQPLRLPEMCTVP